MPAYTPMADHCTQDTTSRLNQAIKRMQEPIRVEKITTQQDSSPPDQPVNLESSNEEFDRTLKKNFSIGAHIPLNIYTIRSDQGQTSIFGWNSYKWHRYSKNTKTNPLANRTGNTKIRKSTNSYLANMIERTQTNIAPRLQPDQKIRHRNWKAPPKKHETRQNRKQ